MRMTDPVTGLASLAGEEREQFRTAVNLLLSEGFLVRSIDRHERSYRFVVGHLELVESYLEWSSRTIRHDSSLGVVACVGPASSRVRLRKEESVVALVLRLLYEEKAGEIALHGERTVRRYEIQDRYQSLTHSAVKKTPFLAMLRRFQSFRLIRLIGDDSDPEATVVLYPSLAFALDGGSIGELEARLAALTGSEGAGSESTGDDRAETEGGDLDEGEEELDLGIESHEEDS
jgi:hypothetical protein